MLRISILTAFPAMFESAFREGIIRIAREGGQLVVEPIDLRAFTTDRHRSVDDAPFGGGAGMVMKPEPIAAALEAVDAGAGERVYRVLLGPQGRAFRQDLARELSRRPRLVLVCGRYKDVDDRVRSLVDDEVSIGDYVLSGGEIPAMVIVDALARLLPGVVGDEESVVTDSFERSRLDAPYYTRPAAFAGSEVPAALRSGDHAAIARWRAKEALRRTVWFRPDLLEKEGLTDEDRRLLREISSELHDWIDRVVAARSDTAQGKG
jgi:tRNA (guanine37-N1)-methyltransferase